MKVFEVKNGKQAGNGEAVTTVKAMDAVCRAMAAAEGQAGKGPPLVFPTMAFVVDAYGDEPTRTYIADSAEEADRVIDAQLHIRSRLMWHYSPQGEITTRNHFQYRYHYPSEQTPNRIGLIELIVRESLCAGCDIKDKDHRKLVFALDRKDVVPVLELYDERRYGDIPIVMRRLAIQLNSTNL